MGGSRISCSLWGKYLKKFFKQNGHDVSDENSEDLYLKSIDPHFCSKKSYVEQRLNY